MTELNTLLHPEEMTWRFRETPMLHSLMPHHRYRQVRVAVVGGGVGGAYIAWHLQRLGFKVTVLSKDAGRLVSSGLSAPGEVNRGGMRLPMDSHVFVRRALIDAELVRSLVPFKNDEPNAFLRLRGNQVRMRDYQALAPLYGAEGLGDPKALLGQLLAKATSELGESPSSIERSLMEGHTLGYQTVRDQLHALGLNDSQCAYVGWVNGIHAYLDTPIGELAVDYQSLYGNRHYATLAGGLQRLPDTLLTRSGAEVVGSATVETIEVGDHGVAVGYHTPSGNRTCRADFVMMTAPAPAVARIRFAPALPIEQTEAFEGIHYASSAKTLMIAKEPFWLADGIEGGMSWTDEPLQQIVYPSNASAGEACTFVASYSWEDRARRLMHAPDPESRTEWLIEGLERIHPGCSQYLRDAEHTDWDARCGYGAFTYYGPGDYARHHRWLSRAFPEVPRVFFSGEHAGLHHGWAEAALQSAQTATLQLLSELTR